MNKLVITNDNIYLDSGSEISLKISKASKFLDVQNIKLKIEKSTDLIIESDILNKKIDLSINVFKGVKANIFELKKGDNYKFQVKYYLEKDSHLNIEKINDVENALEMTVINLNGEKARVDYNLKTISKTREKYNFLVYHNAKNTVSFINNNGVNIFDGELEFNVSSFVPNGIKKCDVNQSARIINQTDKICTIKPNLFIDEQDVVANHSALIGTFSYDEMFYIMSRGISETEANHLLIRGFLMKKITYHKKQLENIINRYWR